MAIYKKASIIATLNINIFIMAHKINYDLNKSFKALSNPVRLKIFVEILKEACECDLDKKGQISGNCVSNISKKLKLSQPTVSNHVKELVNANLIITVRNGRNIYLFGAEKTAKDFADFGEFFVDEVFGHEHEE